MQVDNEKFKDKLRVILKEVIRVCEKNNLRYYMCGGTCLGAVRHGDIIPWDDDIDIFLLRPDYEKFLQIADKELKTPFRLVNYNTHKGYTCAFAKVVDFSTTLIQHRYPFFASGLYVDIFPLDGVNNNKFMDRLHYAFHKVVHYLFMPIESYRVDNGCSFPVKCGYYVKRFLSPLRNTMFELRESILRKRTIEDKKYVRSYNSQWGLRHTALREDFDDYIMMPFGDMQVRVPKGYDDYLTHLYKDYMKLPPKEKQVTHHHFAYLDMDNRLYDDEIEKFRISINGEYA